MSEYIQIIFMAVFQGVAEFLPISSSGHLELLGMLFGIAEDERFSLSILLHSGTLLAMLCFYFKDITGIFLKREWRTILLVIIGSIPAGVGGLFVKFSGMDEFFHEPFLLGSAFILTGFLLLSLRRIQQKEIEYVPLNAMSASSALAIGFLQLIAILPGVSRSGTTIFAGAKSRLSPDDNAKFSFYLAMAAIGGATLLEIVSLLMLKKGSEIILSMNTGLYAAGFLVSFASGYLALSLLVRLLKSKKLGLFCFYMFLAGILTLIFDIYMRTK